jgi:hypothetical protein
VCSTALCVLLALQLGRIVRPLGLGWGDPFKARGYHAGCDGSLIFRMAWGFKNPTRAGQPYGTQILQRFDAAGIQWYRSNLTAGQSPTAPVLASVAELRISIGWPVVIWLLLVTLWWLNRASQRRAARSGQLCAKCGYDLRATPQRCPECGTAVSEQRSAVRGQRSQASSPRSYVSGGPEGE